MQNETKENAYWRLKDFIGREMALFCLCAVSDVPYYPGSNADTWEDYVKATAEKDACFMDGETDANEAILAGMDTEERRIAVWGTGNEERPYTDADYRRLDELYKIMTAQLDRVGGVVNKQQEDTARFFSTLALAREKRVASGEKDDIDMAAKLDQMIRKNLEDCNMRAKDVLPQQKQRIDGFVDALRRKYGIGADMTYEQVMNAFYKWCKERKHPQTVDAEEHALHAILKSIQRNDDMPEPSTLPEDMSLAKFEREFADEPNDAEKDAYHYLGLARNVFRGSGDEDEDGQ